MKTLSPKTKPKILNNRHTSGNGRYRWDLGLICFDKPVKKNKDETVKDKKNNDVE